MIRILQQLFVIAAIGLLTANLQADVYVTTYSNTQFNGSGGVDIGPDGNVYVGDFGIRLNNANGSSVKRILPDGTVETFATGLSGASGNDWGPDGYFYQSNIAGNRVSKVSPDGVVTTLATGIINPVGCVAAPDGFVYATNCRTPGAIDKIAPDGSVTTLVESDLLACPNGLTIDDDGNLYTCNFNNGNVVKITPAGVASIVGTIPSSACGHLTYANGILYVVGRCANQVFMMTLDGEVTLLAGSGTRGILDGPANQAMFSTPNGIRATVTGDTLFVNDSVDLSGGCYNGDLNPVVVRMITGVLEPLGIEKPDAQSHGSIKLRQNYPNPFNPATTIQYSLAEPSPVVLQVFNAAGQTVKTLVDAPQGGGQYAVMWDGTNANGQMVSTGQYTYQLQVGNEQHRRSMTILK